MISKDDEENIMKGLGSASKKLADAFFWQQQQRVWVTGRAEADKACTEEQRLHNEQMKKFEKLESIRNAHEWLSEYLFWKRDWCYREQAEEWYQDFGEQRMGT